MAVAGEGRHLNLFPQQIVTNRELVMNGNGNVFGGPMDFASSSGMTAATETMIPMYVSTAMKCESGLTYLPPVSRKRSREAITSFPIAVRNQTLNNPCTTFTFLGEDISFEIQQQQLEIDRFVAQQTEKVRMEIEQRRKRYSRRIAAAAEENIMKKLKAKDEEIDKIWKLNYALEERVKSLCVENQIWQDLARSNEATANALRSSLEQVLADQVLQDEQRDLIDDANSCCGSNYEERAVWNPSASTHGSYRDCNNVNRRNGKCRSCGREESCVLLLPCRHLCLCTICGSTLHICPVCNVTKTASVHVNLFC